MLVWRLLVCLPCHARQKVPLLQYVPSALCLQSICSLSVPSFPLYALPVDFSFWSPTTFYAFSLYLNKSSVLWNYYWLQNLLRVGIKVSLYLYQNHLLKCRIVTNVPCKKVNALLFFLLSWNSHRTHGAIIYPSNILYVWCFTDLCEWKVILKTPRNGRRYANFFLELNH